MVNEKGKVIEGLSYNKLVEKLLEFRSITAVDPSAQGEQCSDIARMKSSITSGIAECNDGHEAESPHLVTEAKGASVGPVQVPHDDAAAAGETCARSGGDGASSPSSASNQEGPDPILHRGEPPSDTAVAQASDGIANTDSAKAATALREGQVAEEFFRDTASQLTYYGLAQLYQEVRDITD